MRRLLLVLLGWLISIPAAPAAQALEENLVWGTTAIKLSPTLTGAPALQDLLMDNAKTVSLGEFYPAGGEIRPATPTECRVAYNRDYLFVVFRCHENDLSFPAMSQKADWYSLLRSPSEQDSGFPDKVDLFIQPDMQHRSFFQFAATINGLTFGSWHGLRSATDETALTSEDAGNRITSHLSKVSAFTATVSRSTSEWIVFFSIPWKTLGGKPADYFGLLPVRTRWRDGEVSSPVAMDFNERPPPDLFIETHFSGATPVRKSETSLAALPSGVLRWERPALLSYPGPEIVRQIWRMQQSLDEATDTNNFAQRLFLTQRWMDLLSLEGFNFRPGTGAIVVHEMEPHVLRRNINIALRNKGILPACQLLDAYLKKLNEVSGHWFADGSPGDILQEEWKIISKVEAITAKDNVLSLHCLAANQPVDLHLSLPRSGGVRIYGDNQGYFKPASLLPLNLVQSANSYSINTSNGRIAIHEAPFTISFCNGANTEVLRLGAGDLAFRFNHDGKIIAVDFKTHPGTNEIIYGFGERYDHLNEDGNVLTLWGMDDWTGNTIGLMNETYKPIPVFHSSKGYMVFDNSSYRLRADVGKTRPNQIRLTQQGPIFDYYFWITSPEKALESYTDLTGKPVLAPEWAFEPWMGRTGRGWTEPSSNPVAEEERVEEQFEKLDIPHSAIYAEGDGNAESPDLNAFMAARGIKVLSWFFPVISEASQAKLMPEKKAKELPVLHTEDPWDHVDFTNPNALELMRRVWKRRLDVGVAGSMVDFGDRVTEDAIFYNGKRGDEMHNFYAYDYHRTCGEIFREKRGDDFILFGRAAAPGDQKWVAQFAGDHPSNFKGLKSVLPGALNLSACGFSIWGSDLGGFLGWPEPAVYMRWTQFGCFSPLMRCHGRTPREPWNYGDAAVANYKFYAWVRENLLNYIYNSAIYSHETGIPMMRSMAVAFPSEPDLAPISDQYMFGRDLLVAPVLDENNSRMIRFPAGRWTSLWSGKTISGPTNVTVKVPLTMVPVYLRSGAIVPLQLDPTLEFGASMSRKRVNALLVTAPTKRETTSLLNKQSHEAAVISRASADSIDLTLQNSAGTDYLLVYNALVSAVEVNGHIIANLQDIAPVSIQPGWYADSGMDRIVVKLPSGTPGISEDIHLKLNAIVAKK